MIKLCNCIIYFCLYNLLGNISEVVAQTQCNTPDQKQGRCIVIRDCPVFLNILEQSIITPDDVDLLRQSQCGYVKNQPKVCCPLERETTKPPVFSSNLLPTTDQCGLLLGQRIVGGEVASLDEFQWMALLEYEKPSGRGFHCGGALISDRYVLTAAHCLNNIPRGWRLSSVRLGEYNLDTAVDCEEYCADAPENIPVEELIPHEQYDAKSVHRYNDIALLRLRRKVTFTDYIIPICLPTITNTNYQGLNMTVAGWGRTETRSQSAKKMKLNVPVTSHGECITTYKKARVDLRADQLCAGGLRGKDSCTGDSGGPLMFLNQTATGPNYYITGIVSFGPTNCGLQDWPGVYTKVVDYIPWIISKIRP